MGCQCFDVVAQHPEGDEDGHRHDNAAIPQAQAQKASASRIITALIWMRRLSTAGVTTCVFKSDQHAIGERRKQRVSYVVEHHDADHADRARPVIGPR